MGLKLYYTGVSQNQEAQGLPSQSIGGHISSTAIQQDINSLFPDIGYQLSKKSCYVLIALYNDGVVTIEGMISIESASDYFDYQLAGVLPTLDNCSNPVFEQLSSQSNKPLYAIFGNTISFTILASSYCGIWIKRTLKPSVNINSPEFSADDKLSIQTQTITPIEENLALIIDF